MATTPDNLADFIAREVWRSYAGARVAFVGYRADGELHSMFLSVIFDSKTPEDLASTTTEIDGVVVHADWLDQATAAQLVASLSQPLVRVGAHVLRLLQDDKPWDWSVGSEPAHGLGWPADSFCWGMGPQAAAFLPAELYFPLASRLPRATPVSFRDWEHVAGWVEPGAKIGPGTRTQVKVHAPTQVAIRTAEVDPSTGTLTVVVQVRAEALRAAGELIVRPAHVAGPIWRLPGPDWIRGQEPEFSGVELALPPDIGCVTVELLVGGAKIQEWKTGSPPTQARIYSLLHPERKWLSGFIGLDGNTKKDGNFDHAVGALLSLFGIATVDYSFGQRGELPDLVGFVPPNAVIAGECTTDAPDLEKLGKLAGRAQAIRAAMQHSHPGVVVVAVMFVKLAPAAIPPALIGAAVHHGIALVALDRLKDLHDRVLGGANNLSMEVFNQLGEWSRTG